jgi:hypothetical protein
MVEHSSLDLRPNLATLPESRPTQAGSLETGFKAFRKSMPDMTSQEFDILQLISSKGR